MPAIKRGAGDTVTGRKGEAVTLSQRAAAFSASLQCLTPPTSPGTSVSVSSHLLVQKVCTGQQRSSDKERVSGAQGAEEAS